VSQHYHYPAREEFARRLANKPFPKGLKTVFLVLALIGVATFLGGVFTGQERAWHALHFNWLYFTVISTAGTAFAAVQRIVTGRWSRPVVRFAGFGVHQCVRDPAGDPAVRREHIHVGRSRSHHDRGEGGVPLAGIFLARASSCSA
jgi:hypothetical protein